MAEIPSDPLQYLTPENQKRTRQTMTREWFEERQRTLQLQKDLKAAREITGVLAEMKTVPLQPSRLDLDRLFAEEDAKDQAVIAAGGDASGLMNFYLSDTTARLKNEQALKKTAVQTCSRLRKVLRGKNLQISRLQTECKRLKEDEDEKDKMSEAGMILTHEYKVLHSNFEDQTVHMQMLRDQVHHFESLRALERQSRDRLRKDNERLRAQLLLLKPAKTGKPAKRKRGKLSATAMAIALTARSEAEVRDRMVMATKKPRVSVSM